MEKEIRIYNYRLNELKTYLFVALFVTGNIVLPQLCHLLPNGGKILLPIYFFTLIASYKYGLRVGLLTAVLSPIVNSLLFGMPTTIVLPLILVKSIILAITASYVANKTKKVSLINLLMIILTYQLLGSLTEWAITSSLYIATQDFRIGIPGMILQLILSFLILNSSKDNN